MESVYYLRKRLLCVVLTFFVTEIRLLAQDVSKSYFLPEFKQASVIIPFEERFQFENFSNGYVTKQTGMRSEAKLNYSYLYGDILFVSPSLDTLSISDVHLVKNVIIGENTFFHDTKYGFVEIIADYDGVKVAKKSQLALVDFHNRTRFDRMESVTSKPGQTTFIGMPATVKLENLTNIRLKPRVLYLVIDKNNRLHIAKRESFLRIYARTKKKVIAYLDTQDVDYQNENDLKEITRYCASLGELP
jgi:hypothetical protein